MSATTEDHTRGHRSRDINPWAIGVAVSAAVLLIMVGIFQILEGLAAIIDDDFYVVVGDYTYGFDVTAWGWIHLVVGALVVVVGAFILRGAPWARAGGMLIALLSAIANFIFIPYYPLWSIVIIAIDVAVIWALAVYDPER
jgi:hypothetical protein